MRLAVEALNALAVPIAVVLNRFHAGTDLHVRNLEWLRACDGLTVVPLPGGEAELVNQVSG